MRVSAQDTVAWIQRHPVATAFAVTLLMALVAYLHIYGSPLKVTNPEHPKFSARNFRFEDYSTGKEFASAAALAFGDISVEEVDNILSKNNRATKTVFTDDPSTASYCRKRRDWLLREVVALHPSYPWCVVIKFDANGHVASAYGRGF